MTIKLGVIGAGIMGTDHVTNLATAISGAAVSHVADIDGDRAASVAAAAGARSTTDARELIRSTKVDAVVIASHDSTHAGFILDCLQAGKPVLCEKPLAPGVEECRAVVAADEEITATTGRSLLSLGFMRRFDPGHRELRRFAASGEAGQALMVHCVSRNTGSAPDATTASAVTNSAIHELDSIPWLLGSPIAEVAWLAGKRSTAAPTGLHDPAFILLRTADGVLSTLELFLNAQFGYSTRCEVVAERGTASLAEPALVATNAAGTRSTPYPEDWRPRFADAYRLELQAWIHSLQRGESSPLATARDGLRAAQAAEALILAARHAGTFVPVDYS
ncbi:Gfo/Idh/MocA family oxidoreductase [Arthrobacter sp. SDTb3-6]|nr:Gfo/Idh/MocA family oxidoreductase [Arthrobacter sp. SDTb3-6]